MSLSNILQFPAPQPTDRDFAAMLAKAFLNPDFVAACVAEGMDFEEYHRIINERAKYNVIVHSSVVILDSNSFVRIETASPFSKDEVASLDPNTLRLLSTKGLYEVSLHPTVNPYDAGQFSYEAPNEQ